MLLGLGAAVGLVSFEAELVVARFKNKKKSSNKDDDNNGMEDGQMYVVKLAA